MSERLKLEYCPHCDGKAHLLRDDADHYVECEVCGIRTSLEDDPETAVAKWNRRTETAAERLAEAAVALDDADKTYMADPCSKTDRTGIDAAGEFNDALSAYRASRATKEGT